MYIKSILLSALLFLLQNNAFSQLFAGKIVCNNIAIENVSILVFDYTQNTQESFTDKEGSFEVNLEKNKEYIVSISKLGFNAYTISLCIENGLNKKITITKDANSPNGMLSNFINERIQYAPMEKKDVAQLFDYAKINSLKKADSIRVIFNKLQVYQYRYIADFLYEDEKDALMNLNLQELEDERDKTLAALTQTTVNIKNKNEVIAILKTQENKSVEESKTKTGNAQLKKIISAQEALYKRIYENGQLFLLEKNENILLYKLKMLAYYSLLKEEMNATSFDTKLYYKRSQLNAKSSAYNFLYMANNSYDKYETHLSLYQKSYQEYIELLKYAKDIEDTSTLSNTIISTQKNIETPLAIPMIKSTDTIANMDDNARKEYIRMALDEEERFKNYSISNSIRKEAGEELNVTTIKIAEDTYEKIINKKGIEKYFKNTKPISAATYKFETTRRYKNALDAVK